MSACAHTREKGGGGRERENGENKVKHVIGPKPVGDMPVLVD